MRDSDKFACRNGAIDPGIAVTAIGPHTKTVMQDADWQLPTLTIAFLAKFEADIRREPVRMNRQIHKPGQHRVFTDAGLPSPPIIHFAPGLKLDPFLFGEFVVLKPSDPNFASHGRGVQPFRRRRIETMGWRDFPREHLMHRDRKGFIVQRFIDIGPMIPLYRALTLFGEPLYCLSMNARSGNHFCEKIMLKPLNLRAFFSTR